MNIFSSILLINNSGGTASGEEPEPPSADFLDGWNRRKPFTVSSSFEVESIVELTVFNTSGTDTTQSVYLDGNIRSDWGDLRFTLEDGVTCIPYAILQKDGTSAKVAINLGTVQSGLFFIYYDGPAEDVFRIMHLTDIHYDPAEPEIDNRDQSLNFIDNAITRAVTYLPHLVAKGGDDVGDVTTSETPRLALFQDVVDKVAEFSAIDPAPEIMHVAPGNHDFDHTLFSAGLRATLGQPWMETNLLYGAKEVGDYLIISLDAQYKSDNTHQSDSHDGNGHVNPDQLTWLTNALSAATKPVIVFCHQPLSEMDSDQWTLTKAVYHTDNRADIRDILEASNKVVCVIHGHTHFSRNDVINGIPYITCTNLGLVNQFGESNGTTNPNTGRWTLIDLDKSSQTIRVRSEAVVSSSPVVMYDQVIPFGLTSFFEDVSNNHEQVYKLGFAATYEKSSFFRDPVQAYVENTARLYKFPNNLAIPDPKLSDNTIKITGRTNSPNFGRIQWYIAPQSGAFRARWWARVSTVKTKYIKFGSSTVASTPGIYIQFHNDGNIKAFNGSTNTNLLTYATSTWYKFDLIVDVSTDTFTLYIDDVLEASDFAFNNSLSTIDRVEIVTETGDLFIDNMRIMPYTDIAITEFQPEETL